VPCQARDQGQQNCCGGANKQTLTQQSKRHLKATDKTGSFVKHSGNFNPDLAENVTVVGTNTLVLVLAGLCSELAGQLPGTISVQEHFKMSLTATELSVALNSDKTSNKHLRVLGEPNELCALWAGFGRVYSASVTSEDGQVSSKNSGMHIDAEGTTTAATAAQFPVIVKVVSAPSGSNLTSLSNQRKV
jgi:hypothetical protein